MTTHTHFPPSQLSITSQSLEEMHNFTNLHTIPTPPPPKSLKIRSTQPRAPIVKPSPAEEELVRRIHRKVGGPSKLSTYDDPAKVRHVVIEALALEQANVSDATRIRKGQLTVFERRVVRTVTNRGAAVRSRMRQRREVQQLKYQLGVRDIKVRNLENIIRRLCAKYAAPLPDMEPHTQEEHSVQSIEPPRVKRQQHISPTFTMDAPYVPLDQELFGNLLDDMITHSPWTSS